MKPIRCLAIDDEYLALKIIADYASKVPFLELVGVSKSALKALDTITNESIELLFLDIQMPEITGMDFLQNLQNPPLVIFTTAYQEYALEGYKYDVADYLLKPIRFERFLKAANKAQDQIVLRRNNSSISESFLESKDHFFIKTSYKSEKVLFADILYIEGQKEYVTFYTHKRKYTRLQSLKSLIEELPKGKFLRVHKSFIVSIDKIDAFYGNVIEIDNQKIPIGRSFKEEVLTILQ